MSYGGNDRGPTLNAVTWAFTGLGIGESVTDIESHGSPELKGGNCEVLTVGLMYYCSDDWSSACFPGDVDEELWLRRCSYHFGGSDHNMLRGLNFRSHQRRIWQTLIRHPS